MLEAVICPVSSPMDPRGPVDFSLFYLLLGWSGYFWALYMNNQKPIIVIKYICIFKFYARVEMIYAPPLQY